MRRICFLIIFFTFISAYLDFAFPEEKPGMFSSDGQLSLIKVVKSAETVGLYEPFEITVELTASYNNPFDADEIELSGIFISPSGSEKNIRGFFFQQFERGGSFHKEELSKKDSPRWKICFTPEETGAYSFYICLKDKSGGLKSERYSFGVEPSDRNGFVRVDLSKTRKYPFFENGKAFFAVGMNIAWADDMRQTFDYDRYFGKLSENGCNFARIWSVRWNLDLEWTEKRKAPGDLYGIGFYSLENSWRLDHIFEEAREKGIYIMLTLGTYGEFMREKGHWGEEDWENNPYNKVNGGPCDEPEDFWNNAEAREFYKKQLSYVISRWGHLPNLMCIEFWNEVNARHEWLEEMADYVKKTDPYGHCVSLSLGYPWGENYDKDKTWSIENIDFTQLHIYGEVVTEDHVGNIAKNVGAMVDKYRKPCLVAEYGIDIHKDDAYYDTKGEGVNLHNGLWSSAMSGSFGGTINWWWDKYVYRKNLYSHYLPFSGFIEQIDWLKGDFSEAETTIPVIVSDNDEVKYTDMVIWPSNIWGDMSSREFAVGSDGQVSGGQLNMYLHGTDKEDIRIKPVFHVDYQVPGRFIVTIGKVSQSGDLRIYADGREIFRKYFPTAPETKTEGGWEKTEFQKQWNIYQAIYNSAYAVDIPEGKHTIMLENEGKDWMQIVNIKLTGYKDASFPEVRVLGLKRDEESILWVQNKANNASSSYNSVKPGEIKNTVFNLRGMEDGFYCIEWWDTYKGGWFKKGKVKSRNGLMKIEVPDFSADLACRVFKREWSGTKRRSNKGWILKTDD
ncbi:DUF5060 domain-containing protein [bacterium]|jgi:hypothetical protein|nr:DUF5060 domain-containing protein [bacterium]